MSCINYNEESEKKKRINKEKDLELQYHHTNLDEITLMTLRKITNDDLSVSCFSPKGGVAHLSLAASVTYSIYH
jgi:hypothetical protein